MATVAVLEVLLGFHPLKLLLRHSLVIFLTLAYHFQLELHTVLSSQLLTLGTELEIVGVDLQRKQSQSMDQQLVRNN